MPHNGQGQGEEKDIDDDVDNGRGDAYGLDIDAVASDGLIESVGHRIALQQENEEGGEPSGNSETGREVYGDVEGTAVGLEQSVI